MSKGIEISFHAQNVKIYSLPLISLKFDYVMDDGRRNKLLMLFNPIPQIPIHISPIIHRIKTAYENSLFIDEDS